MMNRSIMKIFLVATALLGLAACGGGGGSSGSTGTESVVARGAIEGFGSVIVGGVKYEVEGDIVTMEDDDNGTDIITGQAALRLGMNVTVQGQINDDGVTGKASSISYDNDFKGPVGNLTPEDPNTGTRTFELLGTVVVIERGETHFDNTPPISFDTIANGDYVEVSGSLNNSGQLVASYVEKRDELFVEGVTIVEVKGYVDNLGADQFFIGTLPVMYTPSVVDDSLGTLQNDLFVEVKGTVVSNGVGGYIMTATKVEREGFAAGDYSGAYMILEDYITELNTQDMTFRLNGYLIKYNDSTIYEPTSLKGNLANDIKVQVEGIYTTGVVGGDPGDTGGGEEKEYLLAYKIKIRGDKIRVAAEVTSFENNVITFTMFPVGQETPPGPKNTVSIKVDDHTYAPAITVGDFLEVRARPDVEDPSILIATRIDKRDESHDFFLQGPVQSIDDTSITIIGVTYVINAGTEFEGLNDEYLSKDVFFSKVSTGTLVKIKDKNDPDKPDENADGLADELELES